VNDELPSDGTDVLPGTTPPTQAELDAAAAATEAETQARIDEHIELVDLWKQTQG